MARLSEQQRAFLAEAAKRDWIGPGTLYSSVSTTPRSAYMVMKRLEARGLLGRYHEHNPTMFAITEAGRRALDE